MTTRFSGKKIKNGGITLSDPKRWTEDEIQWLVASKESGMNVAEIAAELDRTPISVQVKLKRLSKTSDTYNAKHRELKYAANTSFIETLQPKSVLDLYAGHSWYADKELDLITNDLSADFDTDHHEDALKLLARLYIDNRKFDLIDLDPYGSAYECFDLAIRMAQKGIIISFGEFGHARWKRLDYVRDRYGINDLDEFEPAAFIKEAQRIGRLHKKELVMVDSLQYGNFLRVYFSINRYKVTEQWDKHD